MTMIAGGAAPQHHHGAALDEMEALLRPIARGVLPNRAGQLDYARCRSELLASPAKDLLPGFLYQCLTIFKFKDFITLYDPDAHLREAFVTRSLDRCRAMLAGPAPAPASAPAPAPQQAATEDRSDPRHWMR